MLLRISSESIGCDGAASCGGASPSSQSEYWSPEARPRTGRYDRLGILGLVLLKDNIAARHQLAVFPDFHVPDRGGHQLFSGADGMRIRSPRPSMMIVAILNRAVCVSSIPITSAAFRDCFGR